MRKVARTLFVCTVFMTVISCGTKNETIAIYTSQIINTPGQFRFSK
ncbi:hypothetical protein [Cellulophaga sp. Z1A5H]|nr:hypothetical protein [Cellulophaga sp. Z1A5H]